MSINKLDRITRLLKRFLYKYRKIIPALVVFEKIKGILYTLDSILKGHYVIFHSYFFIN